MIKVLGVFAYGASYDNQFVVDEPPLVSYVIGNLISLYIDRRAVNSAVKNYAT
jgi:hypothetical protein